jgi:hypothetical protein
MPARLVRILLFLLSPAWPGVASAAQYFVSPDGRDDAPGTSLAQPWRTLGRAAAVLQPGGRPERVRFRKVIFSSLADRSNRGATTVYHSRSTTGRDP